MADITLFPKQTQAMIYLEDKSTKRLLYGGGAGGGKSWLGCYWILKQAFRYPGTYWLIGRSELKTLKMTTLVTLFKTAAALGLRTGKDEDLDFNEQSNIIKLQNGSKIYLKDLKLYPRDPNFDNLGSMEITGAFIDEANQITQKARDITWSRIRHRVDEYDLIPKMLMTCNPAKNWVYNEFYDPWTKDTLANYLKFIQAFATDNPEIDRNYVENLRMLPDADQQRLLYGNWDYDDDPARLMDYDKIVDLFTNVFVEKSQTVKTRYITADIALYGSDKFVVWVWQGWVVIGIYVYAKTEADDVVEILKNHAESYNVPRSNIIYDSDGLGGFLRGFMRNAVPFVNNSTPIKAGQDEEFKEEYRNLKAQCSFHLAKKVQANQVYIKSCTPEIEDQICQELSTIKRANIDSDTKLSLVPKERIKENLGRSPDHADAMMMRSYFDIARVKTAEVVGTDSGDGVDGDPDRFHKSWYGEDEGF